MALVLPTSKTPNRIARQIALAELLDADAPKLRIQAALHDAEEVLLCRPRVRGDAAVYPARSSVCRLFKPVRM